MLFGQLTQWLVALWALLTEGHMIADELVGWLVAIGWLGVIG